MQRFRGLGSLNGQGSRKRELVPRVDNVGLAAGHQFHRPARSGRRRPGVARRGRPERFGAAAGRELYRAAWDWPLRQRASLVVAAIEGDAAQQTWENVGRALQAAGKFVEAGRRHRRLLRSGRCARAGAAAHGARTVARGGPAAQTARSGRPMPCPPPNSPGPGQQTRSICSADSIRRWSRTWTWFPLAGADELARLARRHRRASCFPMPST